jgi:hypothetical protein
VIDPYQPDVFIHFWWDPKSNSQGFLSLGGTGNYRVKNRTYKDKGDVDLYDDLKKLYKPKAIAYSKPLTQTKVSERDLKAYEKIEFTRCFNKYPEGLKEFLCRHLKSMFLSQYRCNTEKRKYEKEVGYKYDIIIRTRFDIGFQNMEKDFPDLCKNGQLPLCDGLNRTLPSRKGLEKMFLKARDTGDNFLILVIWDNLWIYSNNAYNKIMRQLYFNFEKRFKDPQGYLMMTKDANGEDLQEMALAAMKLSYLSLPGETVYIIREN